MDHDYSYVDRSNSHTVRSQQTLEVSGLVDEWSVLFELAQRAKGWKGTSSSFRVFDPAVE